MEMAEGIGGRKWSLEPWVPENDDVTPLMYLNQGKYQLAALIMQTPDDEKVVETKKVMHLLVTAPQLWDAANELLKLTRQPKAPSEADVDAAEKRLADMVAKSVGKDDWDKVLQA